MSEGESLQVVHRHDLSVRSGQRYVEVCCDGFVVSSGKVSSQNAHFPCAVGTISFAAWVNLPEPVNLR